MILNTNENIKELGKIQGKYLKSIHSVIILKPLKIATNAKN